MINASKRSKYALKMACVFLAAVLLQSCQSQDAAVDPQSDVLARVDGVAVTAAMVDEFLALKGQRGADADGRKAALKELIRLQAMTNRAREQGVHEEPAVIAQLALNTQRVLLNRFTQRFNEERPVSDEELQQAYNSTVKRSGQQQVRLQSILYVDEQAAVSALLRVEEGVTYEMLADEARANNVPVEELDWVDLSQIPEDYAPVLIDVNEGTVVPVPLRDQYQGKVAWRVFKLLERRHFQPPSLEEVRPGLEQQIRRQKLLDWSQRLAGQSTVEMSDGSQFSFDTDAQ